MDRAPRLPDRAGGTGAGRVPASSAPCGWSRASTVRSGPALDKSSPADFDHALGCSTWNIGPTPARPTGDRVWHRLPLGRLDCDVPRGTSGPSAGRALGRASGARTSCLDVLRGTSHRSPPPSLGDVPRGTILVGLSPKAELFHVEHSLRGRGAPSHESPFSVESAARKNPITLYGGGRLCGGGRRVRPDEVRSRLRGSTVVEILSVEASEYSVSPNGLQSPICDSFCQVDVFTSGRSV